MPVFLVDCIVVVCFCYTVIIIVYFIDILHHLITFVHYNTVKYKKTKKRIAHHISMSNDIYRHIDRYITQN